MMATLSNQKLQTLVGWMGKSIVSTVRFAEFAIKLSSENPSRPHRPTPRNKVFVKKTRETQLDYSHLVKLEKAGSHSGSNPVPGSDPNRVPLAQVVEDCVRRWFQDTLKEAKSGDVGMQVLVGQMYCSGYGIPKDEHKVHFFLKFPIQFLSNFRGFRFFSCNSRRFLGSWWLVCVLELI